MRFLVKEGMYDNIKLSKKQTAILAIKKVCLADVLMFLNIIKKHLTSAVNSIIIYNIKNCLKGELKMEKNKIFEELLNVDVTPYLTKKKAGGKELSYLSWPYAWAEIKKRYPDATYQIWRDEKGLPYAYDPKTGYMVFVTLFAGGQEFPCFLPVMDENNRPMKDKGYNYTYREDGIEISGYVPPASMFDINKTIMRCLVKACAFAGLGLYVYAGEDINTFNEKVNGDNNAINGEEDVKDNGEGANTPKAIPNHHELTREKIQSVGLSLRQVMKYFKGMEYEDLSEEDLTEIDKMCERYSAQSQKTT